LAASTRLIAPAGIEDVVLVLLKDVLLEDVLPEDVLPEDVLPEDVLPEDVLPEDVLPEDVLLEDVLLEDVVLVVVPVGVGTKIEEGVAIGIGVVGVMGFTGVDVGGLPTSTGIGATGIGVNGV
jgi:hypothetical protein